MPMNLGTLMKAKIHNNAKKLLSAQFSVRTVGNKTELTPRKTEYNKAQTETSPEWVDPYTKLDKKTNRFKVTKGYWRDTEKPVKTEKKKSIMGGAASDFSSMSGKEKLVYLMKGNLR
tara:strand:- start:238 stop:588 length:351 start_codon:yes stop_codon:yes gene_type:complete